ncbi:sigma 54-interacting transcriptional regulator [Vibrio sp. SCSIO 43153]|uniref:sigma-54 interaction domain-containing protein n=1 Tax=Vibrio sp. SCSIO 43153 TaxID=2819098 RepID=UPI0020757185|nr:sigma 54-interacting transcriptional regulator [Vibrio sp. SCSIO 43153]USD52156.1 sigma 54-interacting transcriptional regulator [Vibrio sp. SCSIO 43153]
MSQWLAFATELVGIRKPHLLALRFVDLLNKGMKLRDSFLLLPSSDGRNLVPHDSQRQYAWSVTDFDAPFAHVLQSLKTMHLTAEDLIFWRSNRAFSELVENVGMFDSVCVQPLPMGDRQVHSILLMIGENHTVSNVLKDTGFIRFVDVFAQQWKLLTEMEREEQTRMEMKESLYDIQRDSAQRMMANSLATTLIGESAAMQKLREQIVSAANSQLSIMVQGETGTGKELVAAAVHELSSRQSAPMVAVNCAAIPEHLLESELFGYCKGAFSGADTDKQGLIAQADGGTLFLDEIGDMPLTLQAKLLRVLETRTFRPLGGKQEQSSDFRLVSATHVNLIEQVRKKTFRQDLYYRLFQYPISLPNLSVRLDDLALLCSHFVRMFNQQHGTSIRGLNYRALDCLKQYDFPGNVRELKHLVEFGCAQTLDGTEIEAGCFVHRLNLMRNLDPVAESDSASVSEQVLSIEEQSYTPNFAVIDDLKQAINDFEATIITERLTRFSGDRAKAAKSLGIPKRTLAYKCQKLEIKA